MKEKIKTKNKIIRKKKDEFQELIEKSGHNLHLEVAELLRSTGWEVEISPYYYDEIANKPREIDIIAKKLIKVRDNPDIPSEPDIDRYKINLFIECKYLDGEIVFWSDETSSDKIKEAINNSILELNINSDDFRENHHYLKHSWRKITKLFETKQKEKGSNQDIIFSAFTQAIKALICFRDQKREIGIYYPMVVYETKGKNALFSKEKPVGYDLIDNFLLEINYTHKKLTEPILKTETFLVDFINKDDLDLFLRNDLQEEIREINEILRFKSYSKKRSNKV